MITEKEFKDWGGESLFTHFDKETDACIIIAIHSTERGPAGGGVRMKKYPNMEIAVKDVLKLSKAMTYKFATVNLNWGGGKTVIYLTRDLSASEREALLLHFGKIIKDLNGKYYIGPDIGTSSEDMDLIHQTGGPYVYARTKAAGGAGSSSVPTAHGVFAGIETVCQYLYGDKNLQGKRVLIQGMGNVGSKLAEFLKDAGAAILFNDNYLPTIQKYRDVEAYQFVKEEKLYTTACDIFSPCAQGGVLNENTIPLLNCQAIVGAANNQLATETDADRLKDRGILYAPDYVANLGGAMGITAI